MKDKEYSLYYIEKLTVGLWLFSVLPYFVNKNHVTISSERGKSEILLYYLDASRFGLIVSRLTSITLKIEFKRLNFNLGDIHDENGHSTWWNVLFEDSKAVQEFFKDHLEFQKILREYQRENKMLLFLRRRLLVFDDDHSVLIKILLFIRVASQMHNSQQPVDMFLLSAQRPWLNELGKWAKKENVNIIPMKGPHFNMKRVLLTSRSAKHFIKKAMYYGMAIKFTISEKNLWRHKKVTGNNPDPVSSIKDYAASLDPQLAVEFYGHLNLFSPNLHSDLFFCQQSKISGRSILIYFQHPAYPLTHEKYAEIKGRGMSAVVLNSRATITPDAPVFYYVRRRMKMNCPNDVMRDSNDLLVRRDLYRQIANYHEQRNYWINFIRKYNIKIHVSWYRHEAQCLPLADALQNTGGIAVIYQRSFDHVPSPWFATAADVVFGSSEQTFQLERDSGTVVPYYVITGYLGDFRFRFSRRDAQLIRSRLRGHGAERILAYFDENSVADARWGMGHKTTRENFSYLLNKILEDKKVGLIIKPKVPGTLRKRLGEVSRLLQKAENTGRCIVLGEGDLLGSHPPATAAMAADVAVHGHLFGGTAGVEAALTGTPTLLLDRESWFKSPLYKLGEGRVIFKSWDDLWKMLLHHWSTPAGVPGLGDWSPIINDIDPFRDGRAAERMGTYLQWLLEGFKEKLPRETLLADAAERYSKIWGRDKILSVNCDSMEYACVS